MDGTLWDSSKSVADSWNEVIKTLPDVDITLTAADIQSIMGLTMDVIADRFFGTVSKERRMEIMDKCGSHENDYLRIHGGILYPELENTLKKLRKNHRLFIVSNCQQGYIELLMEKGGLGGLISDFDCFGNTGLPKGQTLRLLCERCNVRDAVYVGDTQGDMEASEQAGLPFVWAAYGFGKPAHWDKRIDHFTDLLRL